MARQLRLALSMNGGVSLAVWIGGAVAEIDELRRGDGFWGDLMEEYGYDRKVQVDVLAGASAGGLNGVLLAQAIRTATPFHTFLGLWREHADIDQLVKFSDEVNGEEGTRSLMRGTYFRRQLEAALPEDPATSAVDHDLQLFASATLLDGNRETFRDVKGAPLFDRRSDAYFTVARRGPAARGLDGFDSDDNRATLARIGRATSSLPGGFEPEPFADTDTRSRLAQTFSPQRRDVEVIDGGVLDNVPIARAIKAIGSSRADGATRRVLVYLHPDPSERVTTRPATALNVIRSFVGKRKESLREDIDELRAHNEIAVEQRRKIEGRLQLLLNESFARLTTEQLNAESAAALLMRCAAEPDAEIAWYSPQQARWGSMIDRDNGMSVDELRLSVDAAVAQTPNLLPTHRTARLVRAIQWLVGDAERVADLDLGKVKSELYELELLCDLSLGFQLGQFIRAEKPQDAIATLTSTSETITGLPAVLSDESWRALVTWELEPDGPTDAEPVTATPSTLLRYLSDRLLSVLSELASTRPLGVELDERVGRAGDSTAASLSVLRGLTDDPATITLDELDLTFAPLSMDRHVNAKPIEFVRIAGDASSPAADLFKSVNTVSGNPKIAGTQLGHLGAFFDPGWRENDWQWGRLDAVPVLAAAILDEQALATRAKRTGHDVDPADLVADVVRRRQEQLLNEFAPADRRDRADPMSEQWFTEWSNRDRRVASLVGTASLTRTGLRAALVIKRLLTHGGGVFAKVIGTALLPVVLAVTGVALAGRRATAATTWTVCVLAAPRMGTTGARWVVWSLGLLTGVAITFVTERLVKPTRQRDWWAGYVLAALGLAFGLALLWKHQKFVNGVVPGLDGMRWLWVVPALAAAISAAMLFFWMPRVWRSVSIVLAAVVYGLGAWLDTEAAGHASAWWARFWPIHSLWVYWIAAVLVAPFIVSKWDRVLLRRERGDA